MKNMFESSETFTAYATIEAGYWMIKNIFDSREKRVGIVAAIDKATGYDKHLDNELAKQIIPIIKEVIEAKKFVEIDYAKDLELLNKSSEVVNSIQNAKERDTTDDHSSKNINGNT